MKRRATRRKSSLAFSRSNERNTIVYGTKQRFWRAILREGERDRGKSRWIAKSPSERVFA